MRKNQHKNELPQTGNPERGGPQEAGDEGGSWGRSQHMEVAQQKPEILREWEGKSKEKLAQERPMALREAHGETAMEAPQR